MTTAAQGAAVVSNPIRPVRTTSSSSPEPWEPASSPGEPSPGGPSPAVPSPAGPRRRLRWRRLRRRRLRWRSLHWRSLRGRRLRWRRLRWRRLRWRRLCRGLGRRRRRRLRRRSLRRRSLRGRRRGLRRRRRRRWRRLAGTGSLFQLDRVGLLGLLGLGGLDASLLGVGFAAGHGLGRTALGDGLGADLGPGTLGLLLFFVVAPQQAGDLPLHDNVVVLVLGPNVDVDAGFTIVLAAIHHHAFGGEDVTGPHQLLKRRRRLQHAAIFQPALHGFDGKAQRRRAVGKDRAVAGGLGEVVVEMQGAPVEGGAGKLGDLHAGDGGLLQGRDGIAELDGVPVQARHGAPHIQLFGVSRRSIRSWERPSGRRSLDASSAGAEEGQRRFNDAGSHRGWPAPAGPRSAHRPSWPCR